MKHHRRPRTMATFAVPLLLGTAGTQAAWAGPSQIPANCADCHTTAGKAVKVVPRSKVKGNSIVAAEISYKPSIDFMKPQMIIELGDLDNLLKQDPKEANYMLFDVRGFGDYIDGHLPRAVSLPYYRMIQFKDRLPKDKDTLIVTYCNSHG